MGVGHADLGECYELQRHGPDDQHALLLSRGGLQCGRALAYAYASATTWTDYEEWRRAYFTSAELGDPAISGATADPDHDNFPNLKEFLAGTSPTNGASYLGIMQFAAAPGAELVIRWQSESNKLYALQSAAIRIMAFGGSGGPAAITP